MIADVAASEAHFWKMEAEFMEKGGYYALERPLMMVEKQTTETKSQNKIAKLL